MKLKNLILIVLLIVTLFVISGCAKIAEKAVEKGVENATGVEVDEDKESIKIKTEEGEAEVKTGKSAELPEDFPEDFPLYEGAKLINTVKSTAEGKTTFTVTYQTEDEMKDVFGYFKEKLPENGYEISASLEMPTGSTMSLKKNGQDAGGIMFASEEGTTSIIITVF